MALPSASAAKSVLSNRTLVVRIVGFQNGLPGLLRDLRQDDAADRDDLACRAVHRRSVRALDMIDALRPRPSTAWHTSQSYARAALLAIQLYETNALRWLLDRPKQMPFAELWTHAINHFTPGDFRVVELLADHIPMQTIRNFSPNCWHGINDLELLEWVHACFAIALPKQALLQAVTRGDTAMIDFWLTHERKRLPSRILRHAMKKEQWELFLKLVTDPSLTKDEAERRELVVDAVRGEDLTLLKLLHVKPFTTPPVEALELAAEKGATELFEELCYHHKASDIITARALILAAAHGHLELVKIIFKRTDFVGIHEAIDGAAANGHVEVVRFLHQCKVFTATHNAMDDAAAHGHVDVLQFLHEKRTEGCSPDALARTAATGHDAAVDWLLVHRSEVRCSRGLDGLLLHGRVNDWLLYREEWVLYDTPDVDSKDHLGMLMQQAGRQGKLTAIRFLCDTMHCSDLLSLSIQGAAEIGSVGWLFAIQSVCPHATMIEAQSTAVEIAMTSLSSATDFQPSNAERLDAIKWLLLHCGESDGRMRATAMRMAATYADNASPWYDVRDVAQELLLWLGTRDDNDNNATELARLRSTYVTDAFRFAAWGCACDWVVERAVAWALTETRSKHCESRAMWQEREDDKWLLGPMTWPKRAIERGDLAVLVYAYQLSTSGVVFHDYEIPQFACDGNVLLRAAIASGHLDMVEWCIATCLDGRPDDPDLLAAAVEFGQPAIADWLLLHHPQCCTDHSADRFDVWGGAFATPATLDWLDRLEISYPQLVHLRQPVYIAYSLAHGADVALLERWIQTHEEITDKIGDVLFHAASGGDLATVAFVCHVVERCRRGNAATSPGNTVNEFQVQQAMAIAARANCVGIVQLLFATFPGVNWHYAVRDAAERGHLRVVRFFFANGYEDWATHTHTHRGVRRLAFLCRTRGLRHL